MCITKAVSFWALVNKTIGFQIIKIPTYNQFLLQAINGAIHYVFGGEINGKITN